MCNTGDDTRAWGPPYLQDAIGKDTTEAAYYLSANRRKRSVTIDISRPEGQALIRDLARQSDVVLENYFDRAAPLIKRGPVHLQTHGSETRFRNVFIREIPGEEANELLSQMDGGDDGFKPQLEGDEFTGWTGATNGYELAGGALKAKPGVSGNLLTEDDRRAARPQVLRLSTLKSQIRAEADRAGRIAN